jgi:hypothetical protein
MNKSQRVLLMVGVILFVLCGLFPPVKSHTTRLNLEHTFLFWGAYGYIDFLNLLTRWLIILVLFSSLIYLLTKKQ